MLAFYFLLPDLADDDPSGDEITLNVAFFRQMRLTATSMFLAKVFSSRKFYNQMQIR